MLVIKQISTGNFLSFNFSAGRGNTPLWCESKERAYTYDNEHLANTAINMQSGFLSKDDVVIEPYKAD